MTQPTVITLEEHSLGLWKASIDAGEWEGLNTAGQTAASALDNLGLLIAGVRASQRREAEAEDREAARAKLSRIRRQLADEGSKRYAEARLGAIDHGAVLRDIAASKPGGAK